MSHISRKNSFGKVVFPFLVGNFMSRNRNWFFGRHFVILYPIFDFFPVFWFFWITLSVARVSPPNSFGKVHFWVRVHRDPPLTTNGSAEGLDHLSVKLQNIKWLWVHKVSCMIGIYSIIARIDKNINISQNFIKFDMLLKIMHFHIFVHIPFHTENLIAMTYPYLVFVSPELSSERDYVITHSERSMYVHSIVCSMFCKIDHCIHMYCIHWCIPKGLGHNHSWVESHMWPQQKWGQRSS